MKMWENAFYGSTLTAENKIVHWETEVDQLMRGHKRMVKQILLGADAKADEYNVVEVKISKELYPIDNVCIPIAVLKAGEVRVVNPNLEFYDAKVTFTLVEGSGPVHINGQHIKDDVEVLNVSDMDLNLDLDADSDADADADISQD